MANPNVAKAAMLRQALRVQGMLYLAGRSESQVVPEEVLALIQEDPHYPDKQNVCLTCSTISAIFCEGFWCCEGQGK